MLDKANGACAKVSQGLIDNCAAGHDARGEGDTEDLTKFDVPTLIMHGDDDQVVPIADSAMLSS